MKNNIFVGMVIGLFVFGMVSLANATPLTMNFDSAVSGTIPNGGTYIENGMKITSFSDFSQVGSPLSLSSDNGFYFHGTNQYIIFEMVDGSNFDLLSFDFATNGGPLRWMQTSYDPSTSLALANTPSTYSNVSFSGVEYTNITWFSVHTPWQATELDNITIDTAPVPEPSTMFLLGIGLIGLIGYSIRYKKEGIVS